MLARHLGIPVGRWRWLVAGQVQGVGFRPFVYRVARELQLRGFVRNDAEGVVIECQGNPQVLLEFQKKLQNEHPRLASVRRIVRKQLDPLTSEDDFRIEQSPEASAAAQAHADMTIDTAVCPECLAEILSTSDRRHGYGLTNCTQCGPRYSILRKIPYDRCNTTMSSFEMCPACQAEYVNPADRRFHAQPIACHDCGPSVSLVSTVGDSIPGDPIDVAIQMLLDGKILCIKGLGGFHLAVRADDEQAVARLRRYKQRDHKPFAIMVTDTAAAQRLVELSASAVELMRSAACPIILAPKRTGAAVAGAVAPGNRRLGVMLPYTPIHHLLMQHLPPLVMTSGNISDEPLAIDNDDALGRLGPMCDAFLWHDRPIQRGVDDSVLIDLGSGEPIMIRRSRGFVPRAIALPRDADLPGICLGGELKSTIAVVRGGSAVLSQHLGDLSHPRAFEAFVHAIADLRQLAGIRPRWIAHDLHPAYVSTTYAKKLAAELSVPRIAVQHHHAHAAAVMAEHGLSQRILAVICDGTGYGTDGTIWGGELLAADLAGFERLAHLRPLRLPGGDAAARDTARCGLALLYQAFDHAFSEHPAAARMIPDAARRGVLARMVRDDIACAQSSGAGRYFDGIAALLGVCGHNHFEAQAAMSLEAAAAQWADDHPTAAPELAARASANHQRLFNISNDKPQQIDLSPLVREILSRAADGVQVDELAHLFHEQFARAWAAVVTAASNESGLRVVGLSGGVFCNAILTRRLTELLEAEGLRVLRHRAAPPNDGGLALGQAAVASAAAARMTA